MDLETTSTIAKPNILIELDALLDTRVATVRKLYGDQIASDLLMNKDYRIRGDDQLADIDPRIDPLEFTNAYLKRDIETLDYAAASMMIGYLKKLLEKVQHVIDGNNPVITDAKIFINLYPYELDETRSELIALGISTALGLNEKATVVWLPPQELTLDFMEKAHISTYVVYDINTWANSALPDIEGNTFGVGGVNRLENFTVIAAKLAIDKKLEEEAKAEFEKYGMLDAFEYLSVLPWNLLFELQLLDSVIFTEFDPEEVERIMSIVEKSDNPIDVEVGIVAEFYHILGLTTTRRGNIEELSLRMVQLSERIKDTVLDPTKNDELRILLAEQRFLVDSLSVFVPSQPALDFERFLDANMSRFDISLQNSEVSEAKWNSIGVPCRRIVRNVSSIGKDAYLLVCAEDCTDTDGVVRVKNSLLSSVHAFNPVLEAIPETELSQFTEDIQND